jgi:hypothetical protein
MDPGQKGFDPASSTGFGGAEPARRGVVKTCGLACHDEVARSVAGGDEVVGAIRNPG